MRLHRPSRRPDTTERVLLRRATTTIAVLTAGAVAVVVAAVLLLALFLTIREQRIDAERIVRDAAINADDVNDPPFGVILLFHRPGQPTEVTASAPREFAGLDPTSLAEGSSDLSLGDDHAYRVYAHDRGDLRIVAALDLRYRSRESERMLDALLPAGVLGIVAAAIIGWLVARRAVRPLGDALALQRRFVADASHELRTPLTILHTRAQLLRRRGGTDPALRADLDHLIDDSRAMAEIVDDLLLSSELAHRPTTRQEVDLAELAAAVVASFTPVAERAGVTLIAEVPEGAVAGEAGPAGRAAAAGGAGQAARAAATGDRAATGDGASLADGASSGDEASLADRTGGCRVAGVPAALRRAVSALVDNALGHTGPGGVITVRARRIGDEVELAVADNGEGLDPAEAADLTKRFARGRDAPGHGRRFGLGLALVSEVVQAHGGTLRIDGRPGAGATATIALPAIARSA